MEEMLLKEIGKDIHRQIRDLMPFEFGLAETEIAVISYVQTRMLESTVPLRCIQFVKKLEEQLSEVKANRQHLTLRAFDTYAKIDFETIEQRIKAMKKLLSNSEIPLIERECIGFLIENISKML